MSLEARVWSLVLFSLGTFSSVEFLTGRLAVNHKNAEFLIIGIIAQVVGAFATAMTFTSRVTLSDDAIELRNFFEKKRMLNSEIRGRIELVRATSKGMKSTWKLVPKDNKARTLGLSNSFAFDSTFCEWLDRIPSLDAEDLNCDAEDLN